MKLSHLFILMFFTTMGWAAAFLVPTALVTISGRLQFLAGVFIGFLPYSTRETILIIIVLIPFNLLIALTGLGQKLILSKLTSSKYPATVNRKWYGPRFIDFLVASAVSTVIGVNIIHSIYSYSVYYYPYAYPSIILYTCVLVGLAQGSALLRNLGTQNRKQAIAWALYTWIGILIAFETSYWIGHLGQFNRDLAVLSIVGIGICAALIGLTVALVTHSFWTQQDG